MRRSVVVLIGTMLLNLLIVSSQSAGWQWAVLVFGIAGTLLALALALEDT